MEDVNGGGKQRGLMAYLREIRDPRRRQGRIYPLPSMLALLVLAGLNGESSLRGMWVWAQRHWGQIKGWLGLGWCPHPPEYGTLWHVLARLDMEEVEQALRRWAAESGAGVVVAVDGKSLRGSQRRSGLPALQVVVAAAGDIGVVLGREGVVGEEALDAAMRLLEGLPLAGRVVTMDAGLGQRKAARAVVGKGGPT